MTPNLSLRQRAALCGVLLAAAICAHAGEEGRLVAPTDHDSIIRSLGPAAASLPDARFTLLSGNGLNRNVVIRQAIVNGVQHAYILNPAWWPVTVTIKLDCPDDILAVKRIEAGKESPTESTQKDKTLSIALAPHQASIVTVKPPADFLSAETHVPDAVRQDITEQLTDLSLILPQLATRRPNLIGKNPGFETMDHRKLPIHWQIFDWHTKGSAFGPDTMNVREGEQSFYMDNTSHGKTIGMVSDRIRIHPGRAYTFAVDLGTDAQPGKARIGFTARKHIAKTVVPDNVWREFAVELPATDSMLFAPTGALRVEVHNDAKGVLWVDDARVMDSTLAGLEASQKVELFVERLASLYAEGDMVGCVQILQEDIIRELLAKVAELKRGNEWLTVGPFASASDADLLKARPPEKDVFDGAALREKGYDGRDGRKIEWVTSWTAIGGESTGYLDLCAAIGPYDTSIGYAYTRIHSDLNQKVTLLLDSDDRIVAWVNGRPAAPRRGDKEEQPRGAADAELKIGWNDILLKVRNSEGPWGFSLTVADENGTPLKGITYGQRLLAPGGADPG